MNNRSASRVIDALLLYLLTAGAALPALLAPSAIDHDVNYLSFWFWGIPLVIVSSLAVSFHPKRTVAAGALFFLVIPAIIASRLILLNLPYGNDKFPLHLALGGGLTLYFIGVGRILGGPRGRLPRGEGDRAAFCTLGLLALYAIFGPSYAAGFLARETDAPIHEGSVFFIRSYALLLAVSLSLALVPRLTMRENAQIAERRSALKAAFYLGIACMSCFIAAHL